MDCQGVEWSPTKSAERITRALLVFPSRVLMRLLAFSLHLLGARRQVVAALVGMPEESVKTAIRLAMRDGFAALRDRRYSEAKFSSPMIPPAAPGIAVRREADWYVVDFGTPDRLLKIPVGATVQAKTVLLSLVNANLVSVQEVAAVLGLHPGHCRQLAKKLSKHDVQDALLDKRRGLKQELIFTPEVKSELIQQFALNALSGWPTSGRAIAKDLQERCEIEVSERTVRLQLNKLGLSKIARTLPQLLEAQKKTSSSS